MTMCSYCNTSNLQNLKPVDFVFAQIFHILLFYTTLSPHCDVTSHVICINQNLEKLGNQEGYHNKINAILHYFESCFKRANKKFDYGLCRPFDSHIMISAYFAICCDVHSTPRPENTSSDRRLIHYTREQLISFNNRASNINDIGIHGLLRLHISLL